MGGGFNPGEGSRSASRHVRGAWQTKPSNDKKFHQRNQHFLAKTTIVVRCLGVEPRRRQRERSTVVRREASPLQGARGPNTQVNAACASSTQAICMASDWIKTGRCERVIVVGADDAALRDGLPDEHER